MPFNLALAPLDADHVLYRELRLFNLYRILEAALLVLAVFGPVAGTLELPRHELLARAVVIAYLFVSLVGFALGRRIDVRVSAGIGIAADLFFGVLAMHALPAAGTGIALMLMFNVGAASLLLPPRLAFAAAGTAVLLLVGEYVWSTADEGPTRWLAEPVMFAIGYAALATLMNVLGRQMRESYEIVALRTTENETSRRSTS